MRATWSENSAVAGLLLAFLALHLTLKVQSAPREAWAAPQAGPDISQLQGSLVDLSQTPLGRPGGRLTIVAFFETWCGPCKLELPELQLLHASQASAGLRVVGVYGPTSDADIASFQQQFGLTFELVRDADGALAKLFHVKGVPSSAILDAGGKVLRATGGLDAGLVSYVVTTLPTGGP